LFPTGNTIAVLLFAAQSLLGFQQPFFVLLEAVERLKEFASGQCGETNNALGDQCRLESKPRNSAMRSFSPFESQLIGSAQFSMKA
jgi:hypothetical protein